MDIHSSTCTILPEGNCMPDTFLLPSALEHRALLSRPVQDQETNSAGPLQTDLTLAPTIPAVGPDRWNHWTCSSNGEWGTLAWWFRICVCNASSPPYNPPPVLGAGKLVLTHLFCSISWVTSQSLGFGFWVSKPWRLHYSLQKITSLQLGMADPKFQKGKANNNKTSREQNRQ